MRWLAIALLVLNLAYLSMRIWLFPVEQSVPQFDQLPELSGELILLEQSGLEKVEVKEPAKTATEATQCQFIGPLKNEERLQSFEQRLQVLSIPYQIQEQLQETQPLNWVYVPPLPSIDQARLMLAQLRKMGYDSFLVSEGEFKNSISLGYFSSDQNARNLEAKVEKDGFAVDLRSIVRTQSLYWLRLADDGLFDEGAIESTFARYPEARMEKNDCNWLISS